MPLFGSPNVSKLAAKGDLKGLIKALDYQRDWLVRRQAVEALKASGGARAIEALVGALGDSNSTVRDEAAEALAALGVSSVEPRVGTPSDGYSGARGSEAEDVGHPGDARTVEVSPAAPVEPAAPKMATGRARTFRLFVSSTFNDFELERDKLKLWDAASGQELRAFQGHSGGVNDCVFSPNGDVVVSASDDGTLKLWDTTTGRELRTLEARSQVTGCAVSPDGRFVVSTSGALKLWDSMSGRELCSFPVSTECVAVHPHFLRAACAGWSGGI